MHVNQYGFIKSRAIQDCLAWAYEYIYQCRHSKKEIVINLTLQKPLMQLSTMWSLKWWNISVLMISGVSCDWSQRILASWFSAIFLIGVPGKQRGPLSPLLFVLATDLLLCIINKGNRDGHFEFTIPSCEMDKYPIIQYVDHTILIMKASQMELFTLKGLLESFAQSTGLRVNYKKFLSNKTGEAPASPPSGWLGRQTLVAAPPLLPSPLQLHHCRSRPAAGPHGPPRWRRWSPSSRLVVWRHEMSRADRASPHPQPCGAWRGRLAVTTAVGLLFSLSVVPFPPHMVASARPA